MSQRPQVDEENPCFLGLLSAAAYKGSKDDEEEEELDRAELTTIFTGLQLRSSSRSTFMNSHDIRTPPHAHEDPPHRTWHEVKEFYPSKIVPNLLDFERSSL